MDCAAIATRVKRAFGDESGVQITNDDILRWINDAQKEITNNTDLLQVRKVADMVAGQGTYDIPPDMAHVQSFRVNGEKLRGLSLVEADEYIRKWDDPANVETGMPQYFWKWGNEFYFWPVPDTSSAAAITLYLTRFPVEVLSMSDTPELDQMYHQRIIEYCLQQAYELDENEQMAQVKQQQFKTGLAEVANEENWVEHAAYPTINILPEDM